MVYTTPCGGGGAPLTQSAMFGNATHTRDILDLRMDTLDIGFSLRTSPAGRRLFKTGG